MTDWLDRDADGRRLDAGCGVPPSSWARVLPEIGRTRQGLRRGEVIRGGDARIVGEGGLTSVIQQELWRTVWHGIEETGGADAVRLPSPDDPAPPSPRGEPTLALHRELVGLRRRHRCLHTAVPEQVHVTDEERVCTVTG